MNVETGTETAIFLFWEYLFKIFGILSLQCSHLWASGIANGCQSLARVWLEMVNRDHPLLAAHVNHETSTTIFMSLCLMLRY